MATGEETEKAASGIEEFELSGETGLLVHCTRLRLSRRRIQAIKDIVSDGMDWDLLLKKAAWHRLTPLVSYHLRSQELSHLVPESIMTRLQSIHYASLARNMVFQNELGRLLAAFNKESIPVIVLKGSALLDTVYLDISLRVMSDIDILIRPDDLGRAEALVLGLGYTYLYGRNSSPTETENRHLPNLIHREKGIAIEVHRHIVNTYDAYYFDISDLWTRAHPVCKANAEALVFAPEDLLIHLGINFLSDRRYKSAVALSQLCDISETIKHNGDSLDWDLIVGASREIGFAAGLYAILYACRRILGTPVPADAMQKLRPVQFEPGVADLFLRRRVLDTDQWLAHALVAPQTPYSGGRVLGAVFGRLSRLLGDIFRRNGHDDRRKLEALARIRAGFPQLFRVILKPSKLKEDLLLDRWLHDLHQQTRKDIHGTS
jgi:hypothetical protein